MNVKKMTYRELENGVIKNQYLLGITKNPEEKRRLVAETHEMAVEMDRRWNVAEARRKANA